MMFKFTVLFGRRSPIVSYLSHYPKVVSPLFEKSTIRCYTASCQLVRKTESPLATAQSITRIPFALKSTGVSTQIQLNPHQKKSVLAILNMFDEALTTSSMVYLLSSMARLVKKDCNEREKLQMESPEEESSEYTRLLNCITDNISRLESRQLAVIIWSLAKIQERTHPLLKVCEEEILSRGVGTFDYKTASQIVVGLSLLNWTDTSVFGEVEKAILCRQLDIATFNLRSFAQTVVSFAKTDNGSSQLFELFLNEILSCAFSTFHNNDLSHFVWSFAKRGFQADRLFEKTEAELFRRNISTIVKSVDIGTLLWSFASTGNGSMELFSAFGDLIQTKDIKHFNNNELSQTIWALGKAGVTSDLLFSQFEDEVKKRGIQTFSRNDCEMLLEGFTCFNSGNKELLSSLKSSVLNK